MKKTTVLVSLLYLLLVAFVQTGITGDGEYLGFKLGQHTFDQVKAILKESGASFNDNYGYQGYTQNLPAIKVNHFNKFSKYGTVKEAWLHFTPEKNLYEIFVSWGDAGETFTMFKDALDIKYGSGKSVGLGRKFKKEFLYYDGDVQIGLIRNEFGFGDDRTTALQYTYTTVLEEVKNMRLMVDRDIQKQNAKKAAADL